MMRMASGFLQCRRQRGSATVEYLVVTSLVVIALLVEPNVVVQLLDAIKQVYRAFTYALGLTAPSIPVPSL